MAKKKEEKKFELQPNTYIDLNHKDDAKSILIIGNTANFFGFFNKNEEGMFEIDCSKTSAETIKSLQYLIDSCNKNVSIYIIGNKETIQYYKELFTYFDYNNIKHNIRKFVEIEDDKKYLNIIEKIINKNMKFDYIVQNPPYSGSLHLNFLEKGYEMLADNGQMVVIEPATWLINIRQNGKAKIYDKIKEKLNGHIKKVIVENYNKEFNIVNTVPFSITYIDKSKEYNKIEFTNCGYTQIVNSIYDCNNIGNYNLIWSIFNKISSEDTINNHITNIQYNDNDTYYLLINHDIVATLSNLYVIRPLFALSDSSYFKNTFGKYFQSFICPLMQFKRNEISKTIHMKAAQGGSSKNNVKLTDIPSNCIYGTYEQLENYKFNIINLYLPLFVSISLICDTHSAFVRDFIPWLADKKYTNTEIYKLFNFNNDEIHLIEQTIKKFEKDSPWFKRYMCGKDSVSDEEVQKFIDNL